MGEIVNLNKARKARDKAAAKLIWLALRNITAEHGRSVREWCEVMKQLAIAYGERFSPLAS